MWRLTRAYSSAHLAFLQALAAEQKGLQPHPVPNLLNFPATRGFTLQQSPASNLVSLVKSEGDYQVTVTFTSQPLEKTTEADSDEDEDQEEPFESTFGEFQVAITRNSQGLMFECQSMAAQMDIKNVVILPQADEEMYAGPIYVFLENKLKRALLDYIRDFGITDATAAFVEYYSKEKEKEVYGEWLGKGQQFIRKKT